MPKIKMQTEFDVPDDVFEQSVERAIKNNPDYVLVVRCRYCVYNENGTCTHSENYDDTRYRPDYFCADGERRTDDA